MLRLTRQRRVILEELQQAPFHPTADELYRRVKKRLPSISLATVYRNLEHLAAHGKIRRIDLLKSQRRFDNNLQEHYHVRCIECGRIDDVVLENVAYFQKRMSVKTNYEICEMQMEFLGFCPSCRDRKASV